MNKQLRSQVIWIPILTLVLLSSHASAQVPQDMTFSGRDPYSLLDIAMASFSDGMTTPYEELRPIYARPPSISRPKPAR